MSEKKYNCDKMTDEEILNAFNMARIEKLHVVRPKMYVKREILHILTAVAFLIVYITGVSKITEDSAETLRLMLTAAGVAAVLISQMKNLVLVMIYLYQRFAPGFVRAACVFQPCCSEYMRLSVIKYGVYRGAVKGFKRIGRCHFPNGGVDEP